MVPPTAEKVAWRGRISGSSSAPIRSLGSSTRWDIRFVSIPRSFPPTSALTATNSFSNSPICASGSNAAACLSSALTLRRGNWSATFAIPAQAGNYPHVWSTIMTSAPIPLASPSPTASMMCGRTEVRSWWASRMTPRHSPHTPFRIGGSPKGWSGIRDPGNYSF